jgi:uridine kinase
MKFDEHLIARIDALPAPAIIGVSGFGGSGKSTFAARLASRLKAEVVGADAFWTDKAEYSLWECVDFARLVREVLLPVLNGAGAITFGQYDWAAKRITRATSVTVGRRMIVEGVGLFRPTLLRYFALRVWIDCPLDEAMRRGKKRDRDVYGSPQDEAWEGIWRRNDEEYARTFKPQETAHWIVGNREPVAPGARS